MQSIRLLAVLSFVAALGALPTEVSAVPIGSLDSRHPYVGSVGGLYDGFMYFPGATGVLIAPDVVLTAGHVAEFTAPGGEVVFLTGAELWSDVETLTTISSAVFHPLYDPDDPLGGFDLALLFLSTPVLLDQYAVLAPFAPETFVGEPGEVVGYGGPNAQRRSAQREITLFEDGELIVLEEGFVQPGDSGGGLFVERDGEAVLAGITSWEIAPRGYGGFEPVAYGRSFIDAYVPGAVWYGEALPVPEPCTAALLLTCLVGGAARRAGRKRPRLLG